MPSSRARSPELPAWSALLSVIGEGGYRTTFPFRPPRVVVGRLRPSDLSLPDPGVSSTHCEFSAEAGWLIVRDLESINGTWVNERRIGEARLRDGDVVRIGATQITVHLQGEVRGTGDLKLRRFGRRAVWFGAALALLLGAGALYLVKSRAAAEARLRARYLAAVRAQVQVDPCQSAGGALASVAAVDARIAGRPVPVPPPGRALSATDRQAAAELLGLYRQKSAVYGQALQALGEQLQREREAIERIARAGGRLTEPEDLQIAVRTEGLLGERATRAGAFLASLQALSRENARFTQLVESAALLGQPQLAGELAAFRFSAEAPELLRTCQAEVARAGSSALDTAAALEEE